MTHCPICGGEEYETATQPWFDGVTIVTVACVRCGRRRRIGSRPSPPPEWAWADKPACPNCFGRNTRIERKVVRPGVRPYRWRRCRDCDTAWKDYAFAAPPETDR